MKTIFDMIFYIIPYYDIIFYIILFLFPLITFIIFAIQVLYKKDKSIWKPFHRILNWLPVATIPIYIFPIIEGEHSFKLIPVFIIILYGFLYKIKVLNQSEVIISMIIYIFSNLSLWVLILGLSKSAGV